MFTARVDFEGLEQQQEETGAEFEVKQRVKQKKVTKVSDNHRNLRVAL